MKASHYDTVKPIIWRQDRLQLLDQRLLPCDCSYLDYDTSDAVADAIKTMVVRGAPAIGITAAYGVVLAARAAYARSTEHWRDDMEPMMATLAASRPTAVNLFWALARMKERMAGLDGDPYGPLLQEAQQIHQNDIENNRRMGEFGAQLLSKGDAVLTHCNAGALATGGYGTALGVIRSGVATGKIQQVYADETRPWLQGARLTAWELLQDDIPVTLIADSAAAYLLKKQRVNWIIVGADRVAANGDVANKIGTYGLAVMARFHRIKFMVVAPTSTLDLSVANGGDIPIEERSADEVLTFAGNAIAADAATAWNPVFDVTPADLVDVLVTERGVVQQPTQEKLAKLMAGE